MNFLDAQSFGFSAWRIYLAAALLLGYGAFLLWRWRAKQGTGKGKGSRGRRKKGDHLSTMPLTDTQRIDRLHKVVSLKPGEHADLNDLTFGRFPKFRVAFAGIEHAKGQEFAHIKLELGGATADCGSSVEELGDNDFLIPRATTDEQRCSVHYICGKSDADAVSFLQLKVQKIDITDRSAAIDVLHVRGRRAA